MKRAIVFILLSLGLSCTLYNGCISDGNEIGEAVHKYYTIVFNTDTVYVKASMWGLTGDHIQLTFSTYSFDSKFFDSSACFTHYEPTIYYKVKGDTLELYPTVKAEIPETFSTAIKVKQIVINKLNDINRHKEKYKEYGLKKISVYEE